MSKERIVLDKRRRKDDGTFPIKLYVRNRRGIFISTNYFSLEENFNNGEYDKKEPNFRPKNAALRNMLSTVVNEMIILESSGRLVGMDDNALKKHLQSVLFPNKYAVCEKRDFISYLDEFVSLKQKEGTKSCYTTTRNKIVDFDKECTFETMDKKWLESFERWMHNSGMKINAYAIHLRNIRAIFNYAIDNEYTTCYPFRKFKIKKEETRKRSLSVEQLRMLIHYDCEDYQKRYRDMFVLMFYLIGVNAVDLFLAKPDAIVNGRLEYKRAKTGKLYSIKVEPEAMEILERRKGTDHLLDVADRYKDHTNFTSRFNKALKTFGTWEVDKRHKQKIKYTPYWDFLSSYWARHSWATIAYNDCNIPVDVISQALGHSMGNKVTMVYINTDTKKIDEANRKVIDYVLGCK